MAKTGDVIENPVTGNRATFLQTRGDTGGESLRFEWVIPPRNSLSPNISTRARGSPTRSSPGCYGAARGCNEIPRVPSLLVEGLERGA